MHTHQSFIDTSADGVELYVPYMDVGTHPSLASFAKVVADVFRDHPEVHVNNGPHEVRGVIAIPGAPEFKVCAGIDLEEIGDDEVLEQLVVALCDDTGQDVMALGLGRAHGNDEWGMPDTVSLCNENVSHAVAAQHAHYADLVAIVYMVANGLDGKTAAAAVEPSAN